MLRLAVRTLTRNRARLVISLGGVALALTLILTFDAIMQAARSNVTAYMTESGADVFVSQRGVRNMHMAASVLPASTTAQVRAVPGAEAVTPVLYVTNMIGTPKGRYNAYVIGVPADARIGTPWRMREGRPIPGPGEAVIDRVIADQADVGVGDTVTILGRTFRVSGVSEGTANIVNSIAFIAFEDFARLRPGPATVSYILVRTANGESPGAVVERIRTALGDTATVQTASEFAREETRLVNDMMTDVITVMNLVGFLIGASVLALTVYIAAYAQRHEYGVLKALGAANRDLYTLVLAQAGIAVTVGLVAALGITMALVVVVPRLVPVLALAVTPGSVAKAAGASLLLAVIASILPVRQVAGIDPASVFRGGGE